MCTSYANHIVSAICVVKQPLTKAEFTKLRAEQNKKDNTKLEFRGD